MKKKVLVKIRAQIKQNMELCLYRVKIKTNL